LFLGFHQVSESPDHQARAHQQHQREGNFKDHEQTAQPMARSKKGTLLAFFESVR
jgi:hypothetical protein